MASTRTPEMPDVQGTPLADGVTTFYRPATDGLRAPSVPERVAVDLHVDSSGAELQLRTPTKVYTYFIDGRQIRPLDEASARVRDRAWWEHSIATAEVEAKLAVTRK